MVHNYVTDLIFVTPSRRFAHSLDRTRSMIVVSPFVKPRIVFNASNFEGRLDSSATGLSAALRRVAFDKRAFVIYCRSYNGVWEVFVGYDFWLRSRECGNYCTANSSTRATFLAGEADGVTIVVAEGNICTPFWVELLAELLQLLLLLILLLLLLLLLLYRL